MRAIPNSKSGKHFHQSTRPSQSLHCRFLKNNFRDLSKRSQQRKIDELTICVIYRKKKIQFQIKNKTTFQELNKQLYHHLHQHLLNEAHLPPDKAEKIIKNTVGFQSVDGDINFDYRLSLEKGQIEKTKFFYPFAHKNPHSETIKYKIYNCLAIGGFSKVYLARSYENGQFYAIKFIRKMQGDEFHDSDKYESLKNEINVSQQLDHPFLVKLLQAFETDNFYCMVFQYCPGGELFYLLKKVKMMSQETAKFYFLQILYGIQYLHSKSIIYRDLKPQNILIDSDGNCKIVDFGLSKKIDSRSKTFSYCGSAQYMAPQMILRTGHSFGIDYYSLGALLYELVTGLPPYYTKNHDQLQESIICKQLSFPQHVELSTQIKDLLQRLLKKDQKYRLGSYIGIKQIIFHPWIGKIKSNAILSKEMRVPYQPNLEDYNFDTTELGDDQEQFSALVHQNINHQSKRHHSFRQFYKSDILSKSKHPFDVELAVAEVRETFQQNNQQTRTDPFYKFKRNLSKQRLKEIVRSHNVLERLDNNNSSKSKMHNSIEQKRAKDISKLYPYLNYQKASPKKQKGIIQFIEQRIVKIDRCENKKLRKIKIQKNKILNQQNN